MFKSASSLRRIVLNKKAISLFVFITGSIIIGSINFSHFSKVKGKNNENEVPSCPTCSQPTERTIYAPTIGLPEALGSDIVLNCRSTQVMQITPTFYTAEGEAIVGATFQMQPAEMRFVTVESLMPPEHRNQHVWGGMSLSYTGSLMESGRRLLCAAEHRAAART